MDRLQKIIAQAGIASRRKAEELISQNKVTVNGKVATLGDKATLKDDIKVEGVPISGKEEFVYYVLNKPDKVISSLRDPQGRIVVTDLIREKRRIFPVGRLDYDTTGILLMTNDGELAHRLTHPSYEVKRTYRARITRPLTEQELAFLNSNNVMLEGAPSKQVVEKVDTKSYFVTLHVGTYHHVKKLFELVDTRVLSLDRVSFAGITHKDGKLSRGEYRPLKIKEVRYLKQLVKLI